MGYLDTRQKIIDTLTGRAVGTQIQPINHQEFALALLDYIRQVELITASTLVGTAERGTVPVQSDKANLAYVAACPVGETVVFENFHGQDGQPLQYTADVNSAAIIILTWNKEYWTMTAVPASVLVTADNVNYTTSIRKTYASKSAMEADTNPVDEKNIPITNGQLVSVVNNSDDTHNGIYAREGTGWTFQSGFNFGLVQTTGQNVNHAMSQKATTDALNDVEEKADTATRILPFDGVVRNPTIEMQGISDYDSIVFDEVRGLFLAKKGFKYYNAFPGFDHYNKDLQARTDRLYLRTDTQLVYICDGASLQPFILSESDKAKMGSYPAQFVLDLGLVASQEAGEQEAAKSEVAGNRNISFIRFQVQGVRKLKTSIIMQWPNGIDETAQIMCVDKQQWRRNVTGATGVKGDATTAYPFERTAPHYIFYDTARRIIQLQDYEKREVKKVELPLATSTQDGLMSSTDKKALDNAAEKADTALRMMPFDGVFGNPTIETQGVSSYDAIIFDDIRCMFLARKNNKFYMSFIGIEDYNAITSGTMKARTDRIFFRTDTKRTYIFNGTALSYLSISDEEVAKLANYPNTPLEIPLASEKSQGLMSASDKAKMDAYPRTPQGIDTATEEVPGLMSVDDKAKINNYPSTPLEIPLATLTKPGLMAAADCRNLSGTMSQATQNKNDIATLQSTAEQQDQRISTLETIHAPSDMVEMTIQNDKAQRNVLFFKIEWIDDLEIDGRPINTEGLSGKFYRSLSVGEHKVRFHVSQENRTKRGLLGWADDEAAGYISHVTRIVIPEGWTELPANCFERRLHLEEIVLPSTLETIGGNCFQSLPALHELIIPKGVTTINWSAINDCASLKSIRMGGSESMPLSLASDGIRNCPALTCIEFLPCQLTFKGSTSPFYNLPQLNALICHLTAAPTFEPSTPFGTIGSGTTERKTLYRPAGVAFYDEGAWLNNLRNGLGFYVADL